MSDESRHGDGHAVQMNDTKKAPPRYHSRARESMAAQGRHSKGR